MAEVTTGCIYECEGHSQEGHALAGGHPVIVVGRQSLIDNPGIAIVFPLTSTRPNHPVHWAVEIEDTNSHANIRHIKSLHITKIRGFLGTATPEEIDEIKDGLARDLNYDNQECATALAVDPRQRADPRQSIPVSLENPEQLGFAITYQARSVSTGERFTGYRGEIPDEHLRFAKSALIRCIDP